MCCLVCWVGLGSGDGSVTKAATLLEDGEGSPCGCTKLFRSPKQPLVQREWGRGALGLPVLSTQNITTLSQAPAAP